MSRGKRRRTPPRRPEGELARTAGALARRSRQRERQRAESRPANRWPLIAGGLVVVVMALAALAYLLGWIPGLGPSGASACPAPGDTEPVEVQPPTATPLPAPRAEPAGDGTRVTIETELGVIVIDVFTDSAPVAAQNFVHLAEAGYYDCVVFHRILPGFVIQGGDPQGTGTGGPGYTIRDDHVVGEYERGIVAMARPAGPGGQPIPDSQGSQFFVVLDDSVRDTLPKAGLYAIFGRVVEGMSVVDTIAGGPAADQRALEPVAMTRVTVDRP